MSELIVTVDTATPAGSVALNRGEELLGEVLLHLPGTHSDHILRSLDWLLREAGLSLKEVAAFGVVIGPGSFTGLRVGVATVKGLAHAADKPVVGVSSLETLALQCGVPAMPVCAMLDARKKEVYGAVYDCRQGLPQVLGEERVLSPGRFLEALRGEHLFVGSGAVLYRDLIRQRLGTDARFVTWPMHPPRASSAAVLVLDRLKGGAAIPAREIVPRYIRPSEAEIMLAEKGLQAMS